MDANKGSLSHVLFTRNSQLRLTINYPSTSAGLERSHAHMSIYIPAITKETTYNQALASTLPSYFPHSQSGHQVYNNTSASTNRTLNNTILGARSAYCAVQTSGVKVIPYTHHDSSPRPLPSKPAITKEPSKQPDMSWQIPWLLLARLAKDL